MGPGLHTELDVNNAEDRWKDSLRDKKAAFEYAQTFPNSAG